MVTVGICLFSITTGKTQDMDYAQRLYDSAKEDLDSLGLGAGVSYMPYFNKIKHSADMGYVEAIAYFGCELTKSGYSMLKRDVAKGEKYLNNALAKNSTHAMICMAYHLYHEGKIFECIEWLNTAYTLGDYRAATDLGYLFRTGKLTNHTHAEPKFEKYGENNDLKSALFYMKEAAEKGQANAEIMLSHWYYVGIPGYVSINKAKAKQLLVSALKEKDVAAHPWSTRKAEHVIDDIYGVGWEEKFGL